MLSSFLRPCVRLPGIKIICVAQLCPVTGAAESYICAHTSCMNVGIMSHQSVFLACSHVGSHNALLYHDTGLTAVKGPLHKDMAYQNAGAI